MSVSSANLLTNVDALAAHPEWRAFDCRHDLQNTEYGRQAYARGHIPGALFLHLDDDLSGLKDGRNGRHPLPDVESFARRMTACGVDATTQVVAYDNEGGIFASRLWWLLRWLGHDKVAVLDGGLAAWKRSKRALEETEPTVAPREFTLRPQNMTVDSGQVLADLQSDRMVVLDARSPERFRGENETLDPVGGHIPGALNRFYFDNLDDDGCFFKPVAELRAEFTELLAGRPALRVVQQCGSGVTACHNLLAMELAGLSGSKLYPGSWSEWCADPSRPVARGG
ncbi:MAG: 3-mercaptopyruvate sulfurtransferase [Rhodocyclales bacterium RIFCSPLOWO2_02_FULL_63_24]|nr:MAG: 3-mercaptopyruvate sulfurtransferase [Rhodocyclales bacterium GWA2_65_19]OHC69260.1 MAG: 3-mercaptopyruvate sulfurtransferase [Rhodocyclales bacterium RIFCSPLOWO2_02_FULL_63_24]